ncbi:SRPBCC domain-containing protein [Candidatus Binatus sp.]|uniref:SRPBCC domain-containing protein n=1 Tax=Candidatus Binatus sp. TaxID=2811406 RepID=UPI003CAD5249
MAAKNSAAAESAAREIVFTRVFDAPRALVWKAFTERERMAQWWGMKGFTTRVLELDLRPGGSFLYVMRMPDGREMRGKWVYREIVAPELLVVVHFSTDDTGKPIPHPYDPSLPPEMLTTSRFTEHAGRTTLELRSVPINETPAQRAAFNKLADAMEEGFNNSLDLLDEYLAKA